MKLMKWLTAIGLFWLFFHFLWILISVSPKKMFPSRLEHYAQFYTQPTFSQGWALFAPDPPFYSRRIMFRYKEKNTWSSWVDPINDPKASHKKLRYTNNMIAQHLQTNFEQMQENKGDSAMFYMESGFHVQVVHHYVESYMRNFNYPVAKEFQFALRLDYSPKFENRQELNAKNETTITQFKPWRTGE